MRGFVFGKLLEAPTNGFNQAISATDSIEKRI
jgi:hypothetical protein